MDNEVKNNKNGLVFSFSEDELNEIRDSIGFAHAILDVLSNLDEDSEIDVETITNLTLEAKLRLETAKKSIVDKMR